MKDQIEYLSRQIDILNKLDFNQIINIRDLIVINVDYLEKIKNTIDILIYNKYNQQLKYLAFKFRMGQKKY